MDEFRNRVRVYAGVVVVILAILCIRLIQLQVVSAEAYWGASQSNAVREQRVQPARGAIYDRSGTLLVDNQPSYTIMITPRFFEDDNVPLLADLLSVPDTTVQRKLTEARDWSLFQPSRSFREVSFDTFSRVQEHLYELPGVTYEIEQRRRYHTEAHATHALGYVREIDGRALGKMRDDGYRQGDRIGKTGLESYYEKRLRGEQGSEFMLVDVRGREVKAYRDGREDRAPTSGYDLHLALDHKVQALAESLFVGKRGAAVALDPDNGEIISFVSHPDFDPGIFSRSVSGAEWDSIRTAPADPLYNRATMSGFPPGSTWKPLMSLMALQEGVITANQRVNCPPGYRVGSRVFHNHGYKDEGWINVKKALEVSCNTFYYHLMMETDVNTWSRYARMFEFGQRIPLDVADQSGGLIPDSTYFNETYGRWTAGYTVNLGIGQGDMSVTPMQLARYVAAIANGGTLHVPHFVHELQHPETGEVVQPDIPKPSTVPIDSAHFATVREGMRRVMENGTGQWVQVPGVTSGGKTGTAQNPHGEDHSLFIMFAPFDDPEIAIAVAVENAGYGGSAAAPIASLMAEQYLNGKIDLDIWQRRYWIKRLMEEVRSAPPKGFGAPPDEEESESERVLNADAAPDTVEESRSRSTRSVRLEPIAPIRSTSTTDND
ncbi:penicillin-binding protein 2 [Longibacter salinarum]|uniref:Penicillin-binding protein 2 n=1 Tax=Longibacter salinarum TaxID=1850348 RepID=A0A2A8D0X2_9BACT|nr:penicillin-binding protein 2 [Longibacter salinarum]PEN14453.1 penicillin-binding protein 2 [Longibacter salinarum]